MSINNARDIYPDEFFSILTPTTPWFSVQFRNKVSSGNIETSDIWEELSVKQNTFVKSISIEDSGGAKKLTLVLFDQYFTYIENLVMGSVFFTRASNSLYNKDLSSIAKNDIKLDFAMSKENLTNLRVRIGYADLNESNYFETVASGSVWEERINASKTVIRSPWIYFMINGITNEITDDGLQMTITGVSLSSNVLSNLKIVQQFSKITGKTVDIINNFADILTKVPNSTLRILPFGQGSEQPENANEEIELFLGGEPKRDSNNNIITAYKTVESIFTDICSKIPPKNIEQTVLTEEEESTSSENYSNYSFFVAIDGSGNENISFYYPNPKSSSQSLQRVYDWRENPKTIIRSLNIQTATDFAIMSQKIKIKGLSEQKEIDFLSKKIDTVGGEKAVSSNLGTDKVKEYYDLNNTQPFSFVSDIIDIKETNDKATKKTYLNQLKNEFIKNINRQVFKGTITIPGDAFYFFDKKVRPFEYFIKLNVMRPGPDGVSVKSYLTGNYVVSSINHTIDESGFFTTLSVMRYPLPEEKTQIQNTMVRNVRPDFMT